MQYLATSLCVFSFLVMSDSVTPTDCTDHQAPLSLGFSRQEYWSGCHFLLQGIFPTQGSNPHFLHWHMGSLSSEPPEKPGIRPLIYRTWSRPESGQVLAASGLHPRGRAVRWEHRPLTGFPQPQWVCSPPGTTAGLKNSAEITSHIGVSPSTGFPSQPEQELAGMEANPGG